MVLIDSEKVCASVFIQANMVLIETIKRKRKGEEKVE